MITALIILFSVWRLRSATARSAGRSSRQSDWVSAQRPSAERHSVKRSIARPTVGRPHCQLSHHVTGHNRCARDGSRAGFFGVVWSRRLGIIPGPAIPEAGTGSRARVTAPLSQCRALTLRAVAYNPANSRTNFALERVIRVARLEPRTALFSVGPRGGRSLRHKTLQGALFAPAVAVLSMGVFGPGLIALFSPVWRDALGLDSSRQRHYDRGGPSSDPT